MSYLLSILLAFVKAMNKVFNWLGMKGLAVYTIKDEVLKQWTNQ